MQAIRRIFTGCMIMLTVVMSVGCDETEQAQLQEIQIEDTKSAIKSENDTESRDTESADGEAADEKTADICVYVCGAVNQAGVYTLPVTARIYEAIEMAGGTTSEADAAYLNQAEILTDGERIYVPTKAEVEDGKTTQHMIGAQEGTLGPSDTAEGAAGSLINLNTATKEELMTLTGIGEAKAASIISYRESKGSFSSIEDVKQVEGIKDGVFQKIKDSITVTE